MQTWVWTGFQRKVKLHPRPRKWSLGSRLRYGADSQYFHVHSSDGHPIQAQRDFSAHGQNQALKAVESARRCRKRHDCDIWGLCLCCTCPTQLGQGRKRSNKPNRGLIMKIQARLENNKKQARARPNLSNTTPPPPPNPPLGNAENTPEKGFGCLGAIFD